MYSRQSQRKPVALLMFPALLMAVVLVVLSLASSAGSAHAASNGPHVDVMTLNSDISPASLRYLTNSIHTAENDGATALVIEINTPGGDLGSMESMKTAELNSTVPIISYVSPTGAWAASAGAFVTLAAPVAVMAPGTTIGASSPVTSAGGDIGSTEKAKIESVLISDMTSIQNRYGRTGLDATLKMITDATAYTDEQALQNNIIDLRASNLNDLLAQVNDRPVILNSGTVVLHTAGDSIQTIGASTLDTLYSLLLDPNVIFLLFIVAVVGLFVEISHPGMILPGVVGAIALILFLLGAGSISPNWAGLALMALAFVLLVLDVKLTTHGVLTVGAIASLIFGALIFFNSGGPYSSPHVNTVLVIVMASFVGLLGLYIVMLIMHIRRQRVTTGTEGMIGEIAVAITPLLPDGRVNYAGENWSAVLDDPGISLDPGSAVRIVSVEGLRLHVAPAFDRYISSPSDLAQR
ncbi:MAG TPA: nodulation protein NfeD [Ktedonobacteraceae bacterium]|nr:nodulation protein NfeD [Ktedonobacteraceae bacterium]